MGIWSWGAKKKQNQKPEGPSRIISTRRMKFSEIEELVRDGGNEFDKKQVAYFNKDPRPPFYEVTKCTNGDNMMVKISECLTVARYNDEVAASRGGGTPEMLAQKPARKCWTRPLEYGYRLKMRDMVPHNHTLPDHEVKDVINPEPVVLSKDQVDISVGMFSNEEFDARASALLEEGIRAEIEAFANYADYIRGASPMDIIGRKFQCTLELKEFSLNVIYYK